MSYDRFYADVVLLLRGNGSNDSQVITDERSHTIAVNGNTCIKTATKKYGSGSIYFDGAGDYLATPGADFVIGTGDFTIDGWVYISGYGSAYTIMSNQAGGFGGTFRFYIGATGYLTFQNYTGASVSTSLTIPTGQWVYVAACRKSGVMRLYVNKDKLYQGANTVNMTPDYVGNVLVGWSDFFGGYFSGYMDDVRFTKAGRHDADTIRVPAFEAATTNVPPEISITSVTPARGPVAGGTLVSVQGSGFTDYTTCTVDGNSLTSVQIASDSVLTGYTPPGTTGAKDVVVTNP